MFKYTIIGEVFLFVMIYLSSCNNETQVLQSNNLTKDTSWVYKSLETGANCKGKLVNGKLEGDVISIPIAIFANTPSKFIIKYTNGNETGEYIAYDRNENVVVESVYIKKDNLFKITWFAYGTNRIKFVRYIDLKGQQPCMKNLYGITSPEHGVVRELIYEYDDGPYWVNYSGEYNEGYYSAHYINNGLYQENVYRQPNRKEVEVTFYNEDGTISGKFLMHDDKYALDGELILKYGNGNIKQKDTIVNGLLNGYHIEYYQSGQAMFEYTYKDGKKQGPCKEYYESGMLKKEYQFVDNRKRGMITSYSEQGEIISVEETETDKYYREKWEAEERDAQRESQKSYSSNGQKCSSCGLGSYQGGFCNMCGGASRQRVNESYSKAANCGFCSGTGIVAKGGIRGGNKICPSCNGKGKQIY